jgi:anti-anti-sigma factor
VFSLVLGCKEVAVPTTTTALPTDHHAGRAGARPFSCASVRSDRVVRIAVAGELDIATVPELELALRAAEGVAALVVVDLRRLELTDSSGVRLLLAADRHIRESGGRLVVIRGPFEVEWLFGLLGVDRELELVDQAQATASAAALTGPIAA